MSETNIEQKWSGVICFSPLFSIPIVSLFQSERAIVLKMENEMEYQRGRQCDGLFYSLLLYRHDVPCASRRLRRNVRDDDDDVLVVIVVIRD